METYRSWLLQNAEQIATIESNLKNLTFILPGRFKDAEVASESMHSLVNLVTMFHDEVLVKVVESLPAAVRPVQTAHARYVKHWMQNKRYSRLALAIVVTRQVELLLEMVARKRYGDRGRWNMVVGLEGFKAVCRFMLLRISGGRMLPSHPMAERDLDPESLGAMESALRQLREEKKLKTGRPVVYHRSSASNGIDEGSASVYLRRSDRFVDAMPTGGPEQVSRYLDSKVLYSDRIRPPCDLVHRLNALGNLAEVLHILRPLIYALAIRRWGFRTWRPWLIGVALDVAARSLLKRAMEGPGGIPGGLMGLSHVEESEFKLRLSDMARWALRGPAYDNGLGAMVKSTARYLESANPVFGLLGTLLEDYDFLVTHNYFATT